MFDTIRLLGRGSLLLALTGSAATATTRLTAGLRHPTASYDDLLVAGAAWALVLGATWAVLVSAAAILEVASSGRVSVTSRLGCPAPARRVLLAGLGVVLASGGALAAGPVAAAPDPIDQDRVGPGKGLTLPVPVRPVTGSRASYSLPRQRVEVRPGDSLWRISQRRSPRASTPDVARLVKRAYDANRRVIGNDPDLIRPGQRLVVPRQREATPPRPDNRWETP